MGKHFMGSFHIGWDDAQHLFLPLRVGTTLRGSQFPGRLTRVRRFTPFQSHGPFCSVGRVHHFCCLPRCFILPWWFSEEMTSWVRCLTACHIPRNKGLRALLYWFLHHRKAPGCVMVHVWPTGPDEMGTPGSLTLCLSGMCPVSLCVCACVCERARACARACVCACVCVCVL